MRICIISSTVFPVPIHGYGGLEVVAWLTAKGLAEKGHQVAIVAPDGSSCPGVEVIQMGPARGVSEEQAYERYWKRLLEFDAVIDHSIAGDEHLLVRIDGKCRWLTFTELYEWGLSRSPAAMFENGSIELSVSGLEVPTTAGIHKIEWGKVSSLIRHRRKDPIWRIGTKGGHAVNVTSGHSLMIAGSTGLEVAEASKSKGCFQATARRIPAAKLDMQFWPLNKDVLRSFTLRGKSIADIVTEYRSHIFAAELSRSSAKKASVQTNMSHWKKGIAPGRILPILPNECTVCCYRSAIEFPVRLTDADLVLFGLWIGDGCYDTNSVILNSGEKTRYIAHEVADEYDAVVRISKALPKVRFQINSSLLKTFMTAVGFTGYSDTKRFPDWVFDLSRRQIGLILRGYFSADGHVKQEWSTDGYDAWRLCVNSVNEKLAKQTTVLLALCGIASNINKSKSKSPWTGEDTLMYEVSVPSDAWSRFLVIVGFVQEHRNEILRRGALSRDSWRGDVPYCFVRERIRINSDPHKIVSISRLRSIKGSKIADDFAKSAISWRRIISATETERRDEYVYDLSVPGKENFFVGLQSCHNSWNKFSYFLKREGRFKGPVLGVCHAPIDTMFSKPPPVDRPCIVCISQDQANHYESLFPRSIAKFVRNGIDASFYHPVAAKRTRRFLFVARFSYIKGPALAIEACKKVGAELDLIGDTSITGEPEYLRQCQAMADGKQIRIVGPASRAACVWWMSQAHAFLHPNKAFCEPFGLAPCEAALCGLPIIAWRWGAVRETIEHGRTGLLVRSEDELAQAIQTMLDNPFWSSQETRDYCRQWAKQFSVEAMVDGYERLCMEALETGGW